MNQNLVFGMLLKKPNGKSKSVFYCALASSVVQISVVIVQYFILLCKFSTSLSKDMTPLGHGTSPGYDAK